MPTSNYKQISSILDIVLAVSPTSILDIGAGYGKYGVLCREYLDTARMPNDPSTPYPPPRRIRLDCVEAFADYISALHRYAYDNIYVGDALQVLPGLATGSYDMALAIGMFGHLSADDAAEFIRLTVRVARLALVTTPRVLSPQGPIFENEYEVHRFHSTPRTLKRLVPSCRVVRVVGDSRICLLSSDREVLTGVCRRLRTARWVGFRTAVLERLHLRSAARRIFRRGTRAAPDDASG